MPSTRRLATSKARCPLATCQSGVTNSPFGFGGSREPEQSRPQPGGRDSIPERKVVAIEVDDVKVAHPVIVILRRLDHLCSAFGKFGENTVDIPHKHANSAVAR